jgi:predicted enzyme related to lactoylglutathione lyase
MTNSKEPIFGHGKICYIEIPATDIGESAAFYEKIFGWQVRKRDDGSVGFDDGVGEVSGAWVQGLKPSTGTGMMISIMVDSVQDTLDLIAASGGKIVQPIGRHFPEITATFADPVGNIWSLYQHRG